MYLDPGPHKKRLRVLVSAYACHPPTACAGDPEENILGSGESILGWNLVGQISRFHDAWVITQRRNRSGIERSIGRGEMTGVRFIYVDFPFWPTRFWSNQILLHIYYYCWQILALRTARALHRRLRFDLAHHVTFANYWMPSFIGAFLRVPFVWGPLGGGQKPPASFLPTYSRRERRIEWIRQASQSLVSLVLPSYQSCRRAARVILVCNRETREKFPVRFLPKVAFFPVNGVREGDLRPEKLGPARGARFTWITAGRFIPLKNIAAAIRAFALFSQGHPDSRFVIIGEGPEQGALMRLAAVLDRSGRIEFLPWLPQSALLDRIADSDIFLFPSLRDGGGAVVIEAMACGKPVICLDIGGPGYHVVSGVGIKLLPRDPDSVVRDLVEAMELLFTDLDRRKEMGRAAFERARDYYLWDRLGERLLTIYAKALGK